MIASLIDIINLYLKTKISVKRGMAKKIEASSISNLN